jgi:hypothetical protein
MREKMDTQKIIQSQYLAALAMLEQVIVKCPAALWNAPGDKDKFWEKAYHTLFYVHLYLQDVEADFKPWEKQHEDEEIPYTRDEILEYLLLAKEMVRNRLPRIKLEAESGFYWLPFNKLELQFYNIRHIQQHTGELYERLGTRENIELDWVGMQPT